jgi:alpha-galactosidase/6-phospho-beta-glucosidase family protein
MAKIVLIGAVCVIFAQNFIKDILVNEALRTSEIALMDINAAKLNNAVIFTRKICEKLGVTPKISAPTALRKAVEGAEGMIECDRRKIYQVIALDPLTVAVCSLNEI